MKEKFSESAPAHAPSKPISIKTEQQAQVTDMPASTSTVADSSQNQDAEGNNHLNFICFYFYFSSNFIFRLLDFSRWVFNIREKSSFGCNSCST